MVHVTLTSYLVVTRDGPGTPSPKTMSRTNYRVHFSTYSVCELLRQKTFEDPHPP